MRQRQKGFTLIEIIIGLGIVGFVVAGITMILTTLMMNQPTNQQILLQQVQSAGYHMPRDIQMSSNVTLGAPNGFPVTITIPVDTDTDNDYNVEYSFDSDKLKRKQYDSLDVLISETLISQFVDIDNTTCVNVTVGLYKLTIRVSIGEGASEETVTASYEAHQRLVGDDE